MGSPLLWHRRQALMLAGQLPESLTDAEMVLQAVQELFETFLKGNREEAPERQENVLPFVIS